MQSGQSSFKIKDDSNQVVSTSRGDVDCILDHFNIDVSNPIVVMSQDGSREFLHSNNPKLSYKFYMKATLMENIENDIVSMKSQLKTMEEQIRHKKMEYDESRQDLEKLLSELKELDKVRNMKEKVGILKKQLAWSYVQKKENELCVKKKVLNTEKSTLVARVFFFLEKKKEDMYMCLFHAHVPRVATMLRAKSPNVSRNLVTMRSWKRNTSRAWPNVKRPWKRSMPKPTLDESA